MEELNKWMPLIQLVIAVIIIPLVRAAYRTIQNQEKTIQNQEIQIGELKVIITGQQTQIELLQGIIFETSDAEVIKKHLIERGKHAK